MRDHERARLTEQMCLRNSATLLAELVAVAKRRKQKRTGRYYVDQMRGRAFVTASGQLRQVPVFDNFRPVTIRRALEAVWLPEQRTRQALQAAPTKPKWHKTYKALDGSDLLPTSKPTLETVL